jgi:hypothetical protein
MNNYKRRVFMYVGLLSFIPTFNLFFSIFVWYPSDLSPNQAIGFISLIFMGWIIYNWIKDKREFKDIYNVDKNKRIKK